MRSYNQLFYIFCLSLTTGILWSYMIFANYFNSGWELKKETASLEEKLADSQFQVTLMQYQMKDLEQTVASVIPREKLDQENPYKDLVQNLRAPASIPTLDLSPVLLEKGKKLFSNGKFETAAKEFEKLKNQYPASAYQVQARFFLAESLFLQREFKKCTDVIDEMVTQFPEHELTGFILLRLGQISERNNQTEEAQEIYRTVLNHFPQKPLKEQAQTLLKSLEIE
jgi:tol-pal system protein YbgF